MFDFKSANISEDGELLLPTMSTPGEFSIECDRSDTDHVCLGKFQDELIFWGIVVVEFFVIVYDSNDMSHIHLEPK